MTTTITGFDTFDVRFPTSRHQHGSDAVHTDPDYSAAYVVLRTDRSDSIEGPGEGRDPPGHRGSGERRVGPLGQGGGKGRWCMAWGLIAS
jgi:hypothetical protein